jgi:hypothetical protein
LNFTLSLERYSTEIGIQHYLISKLNGFDSKQIEFYYPQLCYLLSTRVSKSTALENFIIAQAEQDLHLAIIVCHFLSSRTERSDHADSQTLWYFQSALHDISTRPAPSSNPSTTTNDSIITSPQFKVCRRVFNKLQALIFSDPPNPDPSERSPIASTSKLSSLANFIARKKTKNQKLNSPLSALIGLSLTASAIASPHLIVGQGGVGEMMIAQAMNASNEAKEGLDHDDDDEDEEVDQDDEAGHRRSSGSEQDVPVRRAISPVKAKAKRQAPTLSYLPGAPLDRTSPRSTSFALRAAVVRIGAKPRSSILESSISIHQTQSSPYLPSPSYPELSTQRQSPNNRPAASTPYLLHSSPIVPTLSSLPAGADSLPLHFLSSLLRLSSARAQLDLFRSLNTLANKLIAVPKGGAREASLRAEIMGLNHRLSSSNGCCLGMGCPGEGDYYSHLCQSKLLTSSSLSNGSTSSTSSSHQPHSRIVRISPSESVVLNSADRAPYVLHVEVLEGDLDFDPERKGNREDLKRVLAERERNRDGLPSHSLADLVINTVPLNDSIRPTPPSLTLDTTVSTLPSTTTPVAVGSYDPPEEEVDLVEQLYGGSNSVETMTYGQSPTLSKPGELAIHNRALDEAAWTSANDNNNFKRPEPTLNVKSDTFLASLLPPALSPPTSATSPRRSSANGLASMDDYSSRMRTAAIMLAQLSAAQQISTTTASLNTLSALSPVSVVTGIGGVVGAGLGAGVGAIWNRYGASKTAVPSALSRSSAAVALASAERQRVLSFVEATSIRNRIMQEMIQLEEERMARMSTHSGMKFTGSGAAMREENGGMEDQEVVRKAVNKEDPSGAFFLSSSSIH